MILVTLGTQDKSFERLLKAIEKEIIKGTIKDSVIVQAGYTKYESKYMEVFDLIPTDEFEQLIDKCDLLITHGGVGSILTGLSHGKKVIAAPRLAKYKEHTNDHQKQIVEEFAKDGYILELKDFNKLDRLLEMVKGFKPKKYKSNTENMINLIEDYIDGVKKKKMKEKFIDLFKKYKEIISYLIFGALTTIISLVVYYGLVYTVLNPNNPFQLQVANILSWICGVAFAYVTNRLFVFESTNKNKIKEATSFVTSRVLTLFMDMLIMLLGVTVLHFNDKIVKLISQVLVIMGNYILSKLFVFNKTKASSKERN
ncbi:MAG: PssE/Cps14G family polysaccharide biosynthesis glycosyltransferase [Bacilli bacterium]